MLIYSKEDNLTLDTFERVHISKLLAIMMLHLNYRSKSYNKTVERNNIILHSDDSNIIGVFIALSDNKTEYRAGAQKEKIFSSHVNIYSPFFHFLTYGFMDSKVAFQALRTIFKLKQLKVLLGKVRVRQFKQQEIDI